MSFKLIVGKSEVKVVTGNFPAGETLLRIEDTGYALLGAKKLFVCIYYKYEGDQELFSLALLVDAIRRNYLVPLEISLVIDYLPYARQDRVCNKGESLSVKVVADFINSLKFARVYCKDIHSDVGAALINNLIHTSQSICAAGIASVLDVNNTVIVSPDAGASKKVFKFAKEFNFPHVVRADKIRNVLTGDIIETKVYSDHVGNKDFLILDDILDNGGTFIPLAKELRKLTNGKVYLFVTHGLFNSGVDKFYGYFDKIFVSNLMMKEEFKDTYGLIHEI